MYMVGRTRNIMTIARRVSYRGGYFVRNFLFDTRSTIPVTKREDALRRIVIVVVTV